MILLSYREDLACVYVEWVLREKDKNQEMLMSTAL